MMGKRSYTLSCFPPSLPPSLPSSLPSLPSFPPPSLMYSLPHLSLSLLQLLSSGQHYHISLQLEAPESPVNEAIGVFMINITFYTTDHQFLSTSARPVCPLPPSLSLLLILPSFFSPPTLLSSLLFFSTMFCPSFPSSLPLLSSHTTYCLCRQ